MTEHFMINEQPLYNTVLLKTFIDLLEYKYPSVNMSYSQ